MIFAFSFAANPDVNARTYDDQYDQNSFASYNNNIYDKDTDVAANYDLDASDIDAVDIDYVENDYNAAKLNAGELYIADDRDINASDVDIDLTYNPNADALNDNPLNVRKDRDWEVRDVGIDFKDYLDGRDV
jgi:hypothetical protein